MRAQIREVCQLSARQLTAYSRQQQSKLLCIETSEAILYVLAYFPALPLISPSFCPACSKGGTRLAPRERTREVDVAAAATDADYVGFGKQGLSIHSCSNKSGCNPHSVAIHFFNEGTFMHIICHTTVTAWIVPKQILKTKNIFAVYFVRTEACMQC